MSNKPKNRRNVTNNKIKLLRVCVCVYIYIYIYIYMKFIRSRNSTIIIKE